MLKLVILHAIGTWRTDFSSEISHGLPAFTVPEIVHYAYPVWHPRQKYFSQVFVVLFLFTLTTLPLVGCFVHSYTDA